MKNEKSKIYVVAALIWRDGKFLACKRPSGKARAHLWEFVGGKVEQNETPEQALHRECMEELALEVEVFDIFFHTVHCYEDITVDLTLFNCKTEGTPQMLEHDEIRWLSPYETDGYVFCPADAEILKKLRKI